MSVTETLNEGLKRGYKIVVPASDLDAKVNEKLAEAQPEVEMKGFRKGKVPMALLKKNFGQRLMGEAMQEAVDGAMNAHFEETGHRPAMQPEVKMTNEDWKEGDDVEVEMTYEALPDIPDVDLSDIKLERLVVKASDDEVNDALKNLAEKIARKARKPRAAIRSCSTSSARSTAKPSTAVRPKISRWCSAPASSFRASKSSLSA